jgi:hypothetical protein
MGLHVGYFVLAESEELFGADYLELEEIEGKVCGGCCIAD